MRMPRTQAQRFLKAFEQLAADPCREDLDIKALAGRDGFRLRIGGWRAIYRVQDERVVILVLDIGPRGDIYK
jgi:mRNA interferase RelE/StbE